MIKVFNECKCSIVAIEEVPMSQTQNYGIIEGVPLNDSKNIYQINNMIEKPKQSEAPSNMAIIGRYILTPDIFDILKQIKPGKLMNLFF